MSVHQQAWIFANGELNEPALVRRWIRPADLLIAADGGSRHMVGLGLSPAILVGDLDLIVPGLVEAYTDRGVQIIRHPVEKDETDLELAVAVALLKGCRVIRVIGGLGGRLDHSLGNLSILSDPRLREVDIRFVDGRQEAGVIDQEIEITGKPGDLLSLIPVNGAAQGVWTQGLHYPLNHETLLPYQARGISNVFTGTAARVGLTGGQLLWIHIQV